MPPRVQAWASTPPDRVRRQLAILQLLTTRVAAHFDRFPANRDADRVRIQRRIAGRTCLCRHCPITRTRCESVDLWGAIAAVRIFSDSATAAIPVGAPFPSATRTLRPRNHPPVRKGAPALQVDARTPTLDDWHKPRRPYPENHRGCRERSLCRIEGRTEVRFGPIPQIGPRRCALSDVRSRFWGGYTRYGDLTPYVTSISA
jgi:hypothetical protein